MNPQDSAWTIVRVDLAEHLVDALASFFDDEGIAAVITGQRDLTEPAGPAAGRVETHVPAARADALLGALACWLDSLATIDPAAASARVEQSPLPRLDWEASFRRHHRPISVGRRLLVAPPWDVPDAPGREVLVIEPGMAFGTGQHETTRTCLEEIEAAVADGPPRSALDVGTGTGLLAAALARLGVPLVVAFDTDAAVVPLARANLARNRAGDVALFTGGIAAVRGPFDLVVANLLADALITDAVALAAVLAPTGRLVVSGILDTQADAVAAAFPGLRVRGTRGANPWRTLRLERA